MNPLLRPSAPKALIALEDGTCYEGFSAGAAGEAFGELVFNTSVVGYQEIITDPSYAGQVVLFTYPQIGNYGVCVGDEQAERPALAGLIARDVCATPSNWRSHETLPHYLARHGIVAVEGVDTRDLTLHVRDPGTLRCALSTQDLDPKSLIERVRESPLISEHTWVADVSVEEPHEFAAKAATAATSCEFAAKAATSCDFAAEAAKGAKAAEGERALRRIVALDCGQKRGILDCLLQEGLDVEVVPWDSTAKEILARKPDGVFLSNGPGDPRELEGPQAVAEELLGKVPLFGICLGHQMICQATGATMVKLPYGHHGGNQPVKNLLSGMVEVTAQNHNYGVDFSTMGPVVPELSGGFGEHVSDLREWVARGVAPVVANPRWGRIRLTHVALNDGTPEGIQFLDVPAFSVQYHPEASPGPHDANYLFESFRRLVEGDPRYLAIDVRTRRPH